MPINFKKSFFISLGLHLILLLVFLFTKLAWEIKELEFVEISFLSTASSMPRPQLTEVFPLTEEIAGSESELVKLPSRRMLEEIEPELSVRDAGKLTPEERPLQLQKEPTREVQLPQVGVGEKEVAAPTELSLDEKDLPQSTPEVAAGVSQPFKIEGAAAQRQVISKVIPEYPEGLQQEAVVKIRFTVLPNGLVGEMVPLLKGDATLEKLTLDAFRQWRFNPLPPDVPQNPEQGVITFRYLLR